MFRKSGRALLRARLNATGRTVPLMPVAAIPGDSLRRLGADHLRPGGRRTIPRGAAVREGAEMARFQHGSAIVVPAPKGFTLCAGARDGRETRGGEPLMHLPAPSPAAGCSPPSDPA